MRPRPSGLALAALASACVLACADPPAGDGDASTETAGDGDPGDGDPGDGEPGDGDGDPGDGDGDPGDGDGDPIDASPGCGLAPPNPDEAYVGLDVDGVPRQFFLSYSPDYDPTIPSALIVGVHGRDYAGEPMKAYLGLEDQVTPGAQEIFVYPDALSRDFGPWGQLVGWQLGPGAADTPAAGEEDLAFIDAMLDYVEASFCVDRRRVFVTGQSWGGDMSSVLACVRGDRFRASVPVATNGTYQLESPPVACAGEVAMWVMHGKMDEFFAVAVGEEVRDYWLAQNGCDPDAAADLGISLDDATPEDCVEYLDCEVAMRWCLYAGGFGHQIPFDYYAEETMAFFRSF